MNILIISQSAGAPAYGMVLRNYYWAKALTDLGHEVHIAASSFSHSRNAQPKRKLFLNSEKIDGINYHWLWGAKHGGDNNLLRVLSMFLFGLYLYLPFAFLKKKYDLVVFSSPPPFCAQAAVRIAKKNKCKFIYDIRDLWPLTPMLLGGYVEKNPLIKLMGYAEKKAVNNSDIVTAVPKNADKYLKQKNYCLKNFLHVPNAISSTFLDNQDNKVNLDDEALEQINKIKSNCDFIIAHPGAMGRANALDILIHALAQTSANIGLILIGDGPHREKLNDLTQQLKLDNRVLFLSPLPKDQMQNLLSHVDAGYCGLLNSPLYEFGASPTKLNDYMLAELPIVYATNEKNNVVESIECGRVCRPEDIDHIAETIEMLSKTSLEERREMGKRGRIWLREEALTDKQMNKIMEMIGVL